MPLSPKQLSAVRRKAGRKGGRAPHKKRGLQTLTIKKKKEISELGHAARWGTANAAD